ncbi:hypothetical protein GCM10009689_18570 [Brevibacterium antiquum]|uniref:DUF7007 domain-containing protein n=1 Tax=Brevibacterium antiquum TaxID=234835 RepID=UPI0018DF726B|nr:hypothetical protein [Brevibacterium antiquum]
MSNQSRVQSGIPEGGQWSESAKARPNVNGLGGFYDALDESGDLPAQEFTANVYAREGSQSPWGKIQHADQIATGIASVSTASHGGMKLSPERNLKIPREFRQARERWYEEDAEWAVVAKTFPDDFSDRQVEIADKSLRYWSPNEYESAYGERVPYNERSPEFRDDDDPEKVRLYGTPAEREAKFDESSRKHDAEAKAHRLRSKYAGFTPKLTTNQSQKLIRTAVNIDGTPKSMYAVINEGVPGKVAYFNGNKVEHFIEHPTDPERVIPVSKQIWDKFDAPDIRTPRERIELDINVDQHKVDQLERQAKSLSSVSYDQGWQPHDELIEATARINELRENRDALPEDS